MTSPIPSTAHVEMASRQRNAGSCPGQLARAAGRQPYSHLLVHVFSPIPPARPVHPVAAQRFCFPPRRILPAGQAWTWFFTGISHQRANTLPWHEMGPESDDGTGSAPNTVTVQGPQGRNLLLGCPRLNLGWDWLGLCQTQVQGLICKEWRVCLLRRSEILCAICFSAWGMRVSGASRAVLLRGVSLAPLSPSPLPGQRSVPHVLGAGEVPGSRRAAPLPKAPLLLRHARKLCHPFAIHLEGAEKASPKSTARCSQRPSG